MCKNDFHKSSSGTEFEKVKKYIDILDGREKEVIVGRFGLDLKKEKTQREIAKELGISRLNPGHIAPRDPKLLRDLALRFFLLQIKTEAADDDFLFLSVQNVDVFFDFFKLCA